MTTLTPTLSATGRESIVLTVGPASADQFVHLVETFGESQIVVGTDYPFALGDKTPVATLERASLDGATMKAITSTNARRFLGLPEGPR